MAILKIIKTEVKEEVLSQFGVDTNINDILKKLNELKEEHETKNCKVEIKLIEGYYKNGEIDKLLEIKEKLINKERFYRKSSEGKYGLSEEDIEDIFE